MKRSLVVGLVLLAGLLVIPAGQPQAQDVYKFGLSSSLTGPLAVYGDTGRQAIVMALEEINAKGGVLGRKLEVISLDDQGVPTTHVSNVRRLISVDRVPVVFGSFTHLALAGIPVATETKVVYLTSLVTHPLVIKESPWAFSVSINLPKTAEYVTKVAWDRGVRKAVIMVNNAESPRRNGEVIEKTLKALGGEVLLHEVLPAGTDYRSTILRMKAKNPDAVLSNSFVGPQALFIKQMFELGWKVPFYATNPVEEDIFFKTVGDTADGVLYGSLAGDPKRWDDFRERFRAKYGVYPSTFDVQHYDAAYVLAEAIKRGGYTAEGIRKALAEMKDFKGVGGSITFGPERFPDLPLTLKIVKGRTYQFFK